MLENILFIYLNELIFRCKKRTYIYVHLLFPPLQLIVQQLLFVIIYNVHIMIDVYQQHLMVLIRMVLTYDLLDIDHVLNEIILLPPISFLMVY